MAELEKLPANSSINLPKEPLAAGAKFTGKEHCAPEIWNYLAKNARESNAFSTLDVSLQIPIIKKYAAQFEALDALVAKLEPALEAYRADVRLFRDDATTPKKKLELLDKIIKREGEDLHLGTVEPAGVLQAGSDMSAIRKILSDIAAHELMVKHGSGGAAESFKATNLRNLWTPANVPPNTGRSATGSFHFVDLKQGEAVWNAYKSAIDIVNSVNQEIRGADKRGRLAELRSDLQYRVMQGEGREQDEKEKKQTVDNSVTTVSGDLAAFKDAFERKATAEIFDGLQRGIADRERLPANDPRHLTSDQAAKARQNMITEYRGAKAEVQGDKIVMVLTNSAGQKVKLSEAPLPAALTAAQGEELGKRVGQEIVGGNEFKAKTLAVIAAILGEEIPKDNAQKSDVKGNLVVGAGNQGSVGGPTGFAKDVASAECGGVTDIGKSKETLALEGRAAGIAKLSADYSKARTQVLKTHDQAVADAKKAYEARITAIDTQAEEERRNPFFSDYAGQAKRVADSKQEAARVRDAAIAAAGKTRDDAFAVGGSVGPREEVDKQAALLEAEKDKQVREYYAQQVAARVDDNWAKYKKRDSDKLMAVARRLGSDQQPMALSYLSSDLLESFFKERYGEEKARAQNLSTMVGKLGVPATGKITGSVPSVDKVDGLLEGEIVAYFRALQNKKENARKQWEESQRKK
jgi:hypothetical protein